MILIALLASNVILAQKVERYCEIVATSRLFSNRVTIEVNYGDEKTAWQDTRMRDDSGKVVKFNNLVDALNNFGRNGWKLIHSFPVTHGNTNVYHFFLKKEDEITPDNSQYK